MPKKEPLLTPEQEAIRIRSEAQEPLKRRPITEDELNDFSLMENPLNLKTIPEAKKLQDRKIYAFRWCERTPERIDYMTRSLQRPFTWAVVNSTNVSELKKYVDPMVGCIIRLDQVLLYKYWEEHRQVQDAKMRRAEAGIRAGTLEGKKYQMQSKADGVEVLTGEQHRISGGDEIMGQDMLDAAEGEENALVE